MQSARVGAGDVVAVVGAGPVGLAAIMTARPLGASRIIAVDVIPRLEAACAFGATDVIDIGAVDDVAAALRRMSPAASGSTSRSKPSASRYLHHLPRRHPSRRVVNVGVHGKPVEFPIQRADRQHHHSDRPGERDHDQDLLGLTRPTRSPRSASPPITSSWPRSWTPTTSSPPPPPPRPQGRPDSEILGRSKANATASTEQERETSDPAGEK